VGFLPLLLPASSSFSFSFPSLWEREEEPFSPLLCYAEEGRGQKVFPPFPVPVLPLSRSLFPSFRCPFLCIAENLLSSPLPKVKVKVKEARGESKEQAL